MKKLKSTGCAIMYLGITLAMQLVLGIILAVQMGIFQLMTGADKGTFKQIQEAFTGSKYNLILVALVNLIYIAGFGLWYYFIRTKRDVSPVPYRRILSAKNLLLTLGLALCGQFLCDIIMIIFYVGFPTKFQEYVELAERLDISVLPAWAMLFIVGIWSPLAEELIFRAMVFRTMRKGFSFWVSAIVSAAAFGIYHMDVVQGVYAALLGILLAYTYERTNSLLGCYLLHMMFNLSSYAIDALNKSGLIPELVLGVLFLLMEVGSIVAVIFLIRSYSRLFPKRQVEPEIQPAEIEKMGWVQLGNMEEEEDENI